MFESPGTWLPASPAVRLAGGALFPRVRQTVRIPDAREPRSASHHKEIDVITGTALFLRRCGGFVSTSLAARQHAAPNPGSLAHTNAC
jgi:hypothetical protein